jgi:diguanylate cyclase (GGDEF)-like protein/PAS domain S-box-containing protein
MSASPVVLVVDDDTSMRLVIGETLGHAGFKIEEAEDGATALAAFARLQPAIVVLDVDMPQMDGFAACTALRKMPRGATTPVLMLTALNDVASINRAYEVGATDFITKPINWPLLAHRVRYILRASRAFDDLRRNQVSLSKAQRIARLGNWDWDLQRNSLHWAGEVYESFDMPRDRSGATCEAFFRCVHPEDRERIQMAFEAAIAGGAPLDVEHRVIRPDGQVAFIHQRAELTSDQDGRPLCLTGTTQDITQRVQAEERLRLAANALENTAESVMICDANRRIVSVNKAFTTMTGYAPGEVNGRSTELLRSRKHDPAFYSHIWDTVNQTGHWEGELWGQGKNERIYPQWISISQVKDVTGKPSHYVSVSNDISRYKQYEARLEFLAQHDALTDLPNRFSLQSHLEEALLRAGNRGEPVGLMFIDLDHFKSVNDSLGHAAGDELLQAAAQRLRNCVRQSDFVARLGGDEFVVVLDELRHFQEAATVAEKLISVLTRPFTIRGHEVFISASIGISCYPRDGREPEVLLNNADTAMYRAKEHGRNTYHPFSAEMKEQAVDRLVLAKNLRLAVPRQEFRLYHQPRVELCSGRITATEALIRWQHPELGLISPERFIPLAEEAGLIEAIGEWVLRSACEQAKVWQKSALPMFRLAINLSARQFRRHGFAKYVASILAEYKLDAGLLEFELTESMAMQDLEKTRVILSELKELGVAIAIDDFGTGYSSLAYLKRFPVDYLKIDRSFIRDLPADPEDVAITKAIIALAKSLKLRLIGEGVETIAQRCFLEAHGCDEGQGYLFSKPLPATEIEPLLTEKVLYPATREA